ncbi:myosin-K heavy chain isoform X2 [Solenopsis invicta]|uniref:myosin-K heavy chain isoform X2 n=1 Tax=Solenopsis invicta TaxID=13686 RepID=UPI00193EC047|nr:myosin-K heavy chain isoform X2 [Solenopsis invicta]
MGDLSAVPQEKIVDYLLERLESGQIYTWVGSLLLAINPDKIATENIYDLARAYKYDNICDMSHKEVSPHIFAVAARARYRIIQGLGKPSQVIVLSGETGTGKTFNAWKALEFLIRNGASSHIHERRDGVYNILHKISDACRLISAFTTASTERNTVSSRHVQLVWLEYKMGEICGATISSHFLERDRATKGFHNFQIFHQMITTIGGIELANTGLSREVQSMLRTRGWDSIRMRQEFRGGFYATQQAMDTLGFTNNQKNDVFLVLSLLVHMADIQFVQNDDYCTIDIVDEQSRRALENTCRLACVEEEDIIELLTTTLINPHSNCRRHSTYRRNLNTSDVCRYRLHSIIRHLYDLLFHWLINLVNEVLTAHLYSERLGILDIFGFECFDFNGIEQLCINYVNERIQQYFVEKYLVSYRNDLQKEGLIDYEEPSKIMQSYEDRINTIEIYLFATLNDVIVLKLCLSTISNDSSTLIRQICAKSCPATRRYLNVRNENFVVRHYCDIVKYSAYELCSKNTDKIPDEITITFNVSENKFLYSLINKSKPDDGKAKKSTMLSKLRCNVDLLIEELNKCDMHYVRCIKPQRRKWNSPEWDRDELHRQLANAGILDVLPLAKVKYPIQFVYKDFLKRYARSTKPSCNLRTACKRILESSRQTLDDDNSSVYYGKHLIFMRESMFLRLESARKRYRVECVKKIESFWIKYKINTENQLQKNLEENIVNDKRISVQYEQSQFEKSLSEFEQIIPVQDIPFSISGNYGEMVVRIAKKTAYILNWLDDVNREKDSKNYTSILEQLRENYSDQSDNSNCNQDNQARGASHKFADDDNNDGHNNNNKLHNNNLCMRNRHEKNLGYFNEVSSINNNIFYIYYIINAICHSRNNILYLFIITENSYLEGGYVHHTTRHCYAILQKWDFEPTTSGKATS